MEEIRLQEPGKDSTITKLKGHSGGRGGDENLKNTMPGISNVGHGKNGGSSLHNLDPKLLLLPETSEEFKRLPQSLKKKIREAKDYEENKNNNKSASKNDVLDIQEIQLSPKKNGDDKRDSVISNGLDNSGQALLADNEKGGIENSGLSGISKATEPQKGKKNNKKEKGDNKTSKG